jgi:hypothetical protein
LEGELVLQDHNALSLVNGDVGRRNGDPVADRRDDRNAVCVTADEPGEKRADLLRALEEVVGCDLPGLDFRASAASPTARAERSWGDM